MGLQTASGRQLFDCTGVAGAVIRGAHARYRAALKSEPRFAFAEAGGYAIRHYLGTREYCGTETTTWSYNGRVTGKQVIVNWGSCVTVADFWDEWIPGEDDDPIPDDWGGGSGEGGGPYYGPHAPVEKFPRMDTLPDTLEHICDYRVDFACNKPLSTRDSARMYDTLPNQIRPLSEIPDSLLRAECDTLARWFARALEKRIIFVGRTDKFIDSIGAHFGQSTDLGSYEVPVPFHIDPRVFDNANGQLGKKFAWKATWHEVAHAVGGKYHPPGQIHALEDYAGSPYFETIETGVCFKIP